MELVQLIVENTFSDATADSRELQLNVFDRVFSKLVNQGGPIGKVHPIYLMAGEKSKTLGVLTLNKGGSYSFFPELPGEYDFDHMTFGKDLVKNNHHYTRVTAERREKVLPINAELLTNGMYHAVTFVFRQFSLLKPIPKEVIYPEVNVAVVREIGDSFLTSGNPEGSTLLELLPGEGAFCMQFFLIPKSVDYRRMTFFLRPFESIQPGFKLVDGTRPFNAVIPHEYQDDYMLGLLSFFHQGDIGTTLQIVSSAQKKGFYSKLEMVRK
ncbi:MAG TPA: hypothetical protein PKC69_13940 [Chitinophagaceae bacterium]|nr:hypothetical protein [Chitinophagaceae bacterium]